MEIQIDMYQTLALSVVVLMLGQFLKQKISPTIMKTAWREPSPLSRI